MFKNYLKTAFRNLWKSKAFSFINIMGLSFGLTCSLLIMLWVYDEYKIDAFHKNGSQLYSVYERQNHDGTIKAFHSTPGMMADEMKKVLPEVQYATNYAWNDLATFEANNKINKEDGNYAGQDFFKMFTYPLLEGNAATALQSPLDIAVSKKMALLLQPLFFIYADSGDITREFLKPVTLALIIAFPVSWYYMNDWLQDFAYHITISWWVFLAAGCLAILIALVTISFQAIKAAIANPVKSLRTE